MIQIINPELFVVETSHYKGRKNKAFDSNIKHEISLLGGRGTFANIFAKNEIIDVCKSNYNVNVDIKYSPIVETVENNKTKFVNTDPIAVTVFDRNLIDDEICTHDLILLALPVYGRLHKMVSSIGNHDIRLINGSFMVYNEPISLPENTKYTGIYSKILYLAISVPKNLDLHEMITIPEVRNASLIKDPVLPPFILNHTIIKKSYNDTPVYDIKRWADEDSDETSTFHSNMGRSAIFYLGRDRIVK